jgi:hypothetical protein
MGWEGEVEGEIGEEFGKRRWMQNWKEKGFGFCCERRATSRVLSVALYPGAKWENKSDSIARKDSWGCHKFQAELLSHFNTSLTDNEVPVIRP